MKIYLFITLVLSLLMLLMSTTLSHDVDNDLNHAPKKRTYIIHMDKSKKPLVFNDHFNWYDSSLKSVSDSANMLYTYSHVIHGFSTRMSEKEAELLKKQPGVVSVIPQIRYELHTTETPEFLGLGNTAAFRTGSDKLSDLVIGVLDTGVWPESPSYHDEGLGPTPKSWNGQCEVGPNFNSSSCNKKLIGARFFYKGYEQWTGRQFDQNSESKSPRDDLGHGTHTSTTAAGSAVSGANFLGYAPGTASGMAPTARIAAYKVCWNGRCYSADVIAAVDKAIEDGVHIISMSFGGAPRDYYLDSVAIAGFAAAARGILVSASAGNNGPRQGSVSNAAPWMLTVGAGTLDREFPGYVRLGNGKLFKGISSLYPGKPLIDEWIPIVDSYNVSKSLEGIYCLPGTLIPEKVSGKIVICNRGKSSRVGKSVVVKDSGGVAMIFTNDQSSYREDIVTNADFVPTVALSLKQSQEIKSYLNSEANPIATIIFEGTKLGVQPSPVVAAFSSRGPNTITPQVLKPDVLAPGVNILAGWTSEVGPTGLDRDTRRVSFNIISGTSMSCPHVTGLAALIKSVHPEWSPAAIKSALMTTAYWTYRNGETIQDVVTGNHATPFDYGAGHVDPVAALDPGLVYDLGIENYLWFLCATDYTKEQIKTITNSDVNCNYVRSRNHSLGNFNYPSFAVIFKNRARNASITIENTRFLTNVGAPATYKVAVSQVDSVRISVKPESLTFTMTNQKLAYTVTFTAWSRPSSTSQFARLEWSDGKHIVGSPIAFSWSY